MMSRDTAGIGDLFNIMMNVPLDQVTYNIIDYSPPSCLCFRLFFLPSLFTFFIPTPFSSFCFFFPFLFACTGVLPLGFAFLLLFCDIVLALESSATRAGGWGVSAGFPRFLLLLAATSPSSGEIFERLRVPVPDIFFRFRVFEAFFPVFLLAEALSPLNWDIHFFRCFRYSSSLHLLLSSCCQVYVSRCVVWKRDKRIYIKEYIYIYIYIAKDLHLYVDLQHFLHFTCRHIPVQICVLSISRNFDRAP